MEYEFWDAFGSMILLAEHFLCSNWYSILTYGLNLLNVLTSCQGLEMAGFWMKKCEEEEPISRKNKKMLYESPGGNQVDGLPPA